MRFRNIGIIISREYLTRVKKKSFLIITFVVPVLFVALCMIPTLIMMWSKDECKKVQVIDQSGIVASSLSDNNIAAFRDCSGADLDALKTALEDSSDDAILHIGPLDSAAKAPAFVELFFNQPISVDLKMELASQVNAAVEDYRVKEYESATGVDDLKDIISGIKCDTQISELKIGATEDTVTSSEVYMGVSLILAIIIYMFVVMFSGMVMSSVIEEKSSRVVEVLVSSVKSIELMFGKIIGVACVALTQFFLWIALAFVLILVAGSFVDFNSLIGDSAQMEQISQMSSLADPSGDQVTALAQSAENAEIAAVVNALKDLPYAQIIIAFVLFFVFGYLLYASIFAAIGSAVENEGDSTQLQMPVTIPLLVGFLIAFYAFKAPASPLAFWGSIIPFTSPMVMLARIPFGVPMWELVLSITLLVATFVVFAWVSARIYRVGILVSGKKSTFKDLWKWLKQK